MSAPVPAPPTPLRVLVVEGRRRSMRGLKKRLRTAGMGVEVVRSAPSALAATRSTEFHVVLSGLDPREHEAADLLRDVKRTAPSAVRIVLTDGASGDRGLARLAHQVVPMAESDGLVTAIRTVTSVLGLLTRDDLRELVAGVDRLPGAPRVHAALTQLLEERPDADLGDVAAIIERDAAVAAKVLQLVNSAYFGRSVRTADLTEATAFLGLTALRGLVLHHELMRTFRTTDRVRNRFLEDFARHGYDVAMAARDLAPPSEAGEAFTAGLLHDIGQLVLASQRPHEWQLIREQVATSPTSLVEAERTHLGVCHAEVGAALLALWGLPYPVVEAVAYHHTPAKVGPRPGLVGVVHAADAVRNDRPDGPSFDHGTGLDAEWVQAAGIDLGPLTRGTEVQQEPTSG